MDIPLFMSPFFRDRYCLYPFWNSSRKKKLRLGCKKNTWFCSISNQYECLAISVYVWQSEYVREYVLHTFFMVSSDLKYKLMRRDFQPITFLDCSRTYFMYMKYNLFILFSVVHFFQGTSVSITFYLFEHYQLWMMDSKAQKVTKIVCVAH